jgi:ketosteroid isomerase-like protein
MSTRPAALLALAFSLLAACGIRRIPGTEIEDTAQNRAVAEAVEAYRAALEKRDAAGLLALAAPAYLDDAGTPEPGDDLDRQALEANLPKDLAGLDGLKVEITLRRIDVQGDDAIAEVFFEQFYRVTTPDGPVARRDSDMHRFRLKHTAGKWLFVAGF